MRLTIALTLIFSLLLPLAAHAEEDVVASTRNDLMLVAAAGGGGAVLGLSTLSFYDKPSKHLSNIWMGAALGIIGGVIFVAINHAQKSQGEMAQSSKNFSTFERVTWHETESSDYASSFNTLTAAQMWSKEF